MAISAKDIHVMFPNKEIDVIEELLGEIGDANAVIERLLGGDKYTEYKTKSKPKVPDNDHKRDSRRPREPRPQSIDHERKQNEKKENNSQPKKVEEIPARKGVKVAKPKQYVNVAPTAWGNLTIDGSEEKPKEIKKTEVPPPEVKEEPKKEEEKPKQQEPEPVVEEVTKLFAIPEVANADVDISKFGIFKKREGKLIFPQ